ncbi:hypothetical protein IMR62_000242 [Escherichia coli]|nr:hypothetical protein [Escherichia coli]
MKNVIKAAIIGVMALALTGCARTTNFSKLATNLQVNMTCPVVEKIMGKPQRIEHDGGVSYWVWYSMVSFDNIVYVEIEELAPSRVIAKFEGCLLKEWKDLSKTKIEHNIIFVNGIHNAPGTAAKEFK